MEGGMKFTLGYFMAYPGLLCNNGDIPKKLRKAFPMTVTVAICTQNRSLSLKRALESVLAQAAEAPGLEILVVDNGDDGQAALLVESMAAKGGLLRLVKEPVTGLSAARNRALKEASGSWIVYIDDDAELVPGYLKAMTRLLNREGGRAGAFCGPIEVGWESDAPNWFEPGLSAWCNRLDYGPKRREIRWPETPYGTNMAFETALLGNLGGFREDLGRKGAGLMDAEETELFIRMEKLSGRAVIYEPALGVIHYMSPDRLSPYFFVKKAFWHGKSLAALERLHPDRMGGLKNALWVLSSSCFRTVSGRGRGPVTEKVLRASATGYLAGRFSRSSR
jgi:glycosyltransferase involved in cell wall biosynthesis